MAYVRRKTPKVVVLENVNAMMNKKKQVSCGQQTVDMVLIDLGKAGYRAEFFQMTPEDFGLPQHQSRVYIIATHNSLMNCQALPMRIICTIDHLRIRSTSLMAMLESESQLEPCVLVADPPHMPIVIA
jgi:site-specific DNA-cytosine methylase